MAKTMMSDTPNEIFDQEHIRRVKKRASSLGNDFDFLRTEVADRMLERLDEINRPFREIFCFGTLPEMSVRAPKAMIDIYHQTPKDLLNAQNAPYDLIISNLFLHWINDLPGFLIQANQALKADGLFVASMFGGDTLQELRQSFIRAEAEIMGGASPRVSPFADIRDIGGLLQRARFALPVTDMDTITVNYDHPIKLMQDLRGMGETNALNDRSRKFLRRDVMMRTCEIYMQDYANEDGRIPATFQIIYMTGWHPHESQQKPLKPGSGQVNLRDALGKKRT